MGKELGAYLRGHRLEKALAVVDLSKVTGISKAMINYIEVGAREPTIKMIARYAAAIGFDSLNDVLRIRLAEEVAEALSDCGEADTNTGVVELLQSAGFTHLGDIERYERVVASMRTISEKVDELTGVVKAAEETVSTK